jgi:hypothetical protein
VLDSSAELVESAQHAAGHPEPSDVADALRAADRVVDRRQAEQLGKCHEPIDVAGRRFAVVYAKRDAPSSPLDGQEDPEAAAARRRRRMHHAEPIRRSVLGLLEDRRRIGLIDADLDRRTGLRNRSGVYLTPSSPPATFDIYGRVVQGHEPPVEASPVACFAQGWRPWGFVEVAAFEDRMRPSTRRRVLAGRPYDVDGDP